MHFFELVNAELRRFKKLLRNDSLMLSVNNLHIFVSIVAADAPLFGETELSGIDRIADQIFDGTVFPKVPVFRADAAFVHHARNLDIAVSGEK